MSAVCYANCPHDKREDVTMETALENVDLQNDLVQQLTKEAVSAGMASPLREPILEAVEETVGESLETDEPLEVTSERPEDEEGEELPDETGKSRLTKATQGLVVFVVIFVVLYATLRWLTGDGAD
ncbi:hypothetical protein ACYJ1Y_13715 [Natrialbaceae archaeon A-gly3]